jgi:hypothetical protein
MPHGVVGAGPVCQLVLSCATTNEAAENIRGVSQLDAEAHMEVASASSRIAAVRSCHNFSSSLNTANKLMAIEGVKKAKILGTVSTYTLITRPGPALTARGPTPALPIRKHHIESSCRSRSSSPVPTKIVGPVLRF